MAQRFEPCERGLLDDGLGEGAHGVLVRVAEDLDALVTSEKIERYTMAARQIIVNLDKLDAGATLELRYRLKARVSLKAQSGESRVYAYYEPEKKGRARPTLLEVAE